MRLETVHLFGCGSAGTHVIASLLGTTQIDHLFLYDKDTIETRNIGHRLRLHSLFGKRKTIALKEDLIINFSGKIMPQHIYDVQKDITKFPININPDDLIIDCLDNYEARQVTMQFNNVLHVGFSPDHTGMIHWNNGYSVDERQSKEDPCDLEGFYPFLTLLSAVAVMSIMEKKVMDIENNYLIYGKKVEKI